MGPGHWNWWENSDVRCPGLGVYARCGELVNLRCWRCGWRRDPEERQATLVGEATPLWHGHRIKMEAALTAKQEAAWAKWPRLIQEMG